MLVLIDKCSGDQDRILQEATNLHRSLDKFEQKSVLGDVLIGVTQVFPHKREEYLKSFVSSWYKHHDNYNSRVQEWARQVGVDRESTYISCWNRTDSMSLAMWNLYGGGTESVAIRSDISKLKLLLDSNLVWLQKTGFDGDVVDVTYVEGLKEPGDDLRNDIVDRLNLGKDVRVGTFSVKPTMYSYESEVRVIIYPKRNIFDPVVDPHPELKGV